MSRFKRLAALLVLFAFATLLSAGAALAASSAVSDAGFVQAFTAFFSDLKFQAAVVLIIADFAFGVGAALKRHAFKLAYVADFARNDVAFKLAPWAVLYIAAEFAGNQQLVIPGIDLGTAATAFYVAITAAWAGSLISSLKEIGVPIVLKAPDSIAAAENEGD